MRTILSLVEAQDVWLVYIISLIVILQLLILATILSYRLSFIIRSERREKFQSVLITILAKAVNYPARKQKFIKKIEKLVTKQWQRELMLDELVMMCYSFTGVYQQRAQELYDYFEMEKLSMDKLKSRKWHRVIEGMIELSIVGGEDMYKTVMPLLEHPNPHVKRQAKIAVVEIGRIKGLLAMETKIGMMSKWTFISILSILHRNPFKLTTQQVNRLKSSKNPGMRKLSNHLDKFSVAY